MPLLGDDFTAMRVVTAYGEIDLPTHYAGKWFVLFSHRADFTPACTTEFVAFQKRYEKNSFTVIFANLVSHTHS